MPLNQAWRTRSTSSSYVAPFCGACSRAKSQPGAGRPKTHSLRVVARRSEHGLSAC